MSALIRSSWDKPEARLHQRAPIILHRAFCDVTLEEDPVLPRR
jgi:hypothetical protein